MKTAYIYTIVQRWAFIAAVVLLIVMNFLSTSIPFGGNTVAEVSATFHTLITPASYAFSIWGLIYLTLLVFAVFQLNKGKNTRFFRLVFPYFLINVLSNVLWLIAFQHELLGLSVFIMLITLGSLIVIFSYFYRLRNALSTTHRYFFQVPFSLYFGWISIATIVNISAFLYSLQLPVFNNSPELFSIIMLILGATLGLYILFAKKDYIYTFVIVWAYVAIWIQHADVPAIMNTAKFAAIALIAAIAIQFIADRIKVAQYRSTASS
ncbi:tryptophan-rich sensory protein [Cryomorpha ignava]|uniref:Tryptophan-rich sensory protein n=1 Tax=Cryomorpha ignava TaxID=101383 RepID=A0A7K3WV21_9FLAO|nr:tryptophan-rich sensory protein [Cryomorpha ignava]NEN25529.1 tryptophan-rich sensory protein [Cryomorpha ignava]